MHCPQYMGCLLKRLPGIWEILARVRKKVYSLQLFYFDQNPFGRARANALIRKNDRFVLDFAPQNFQNGPVVAEIGQFACRLAPAGRWDQRRVIDFEEHFIPLPACLLSSCWCEPARKLAYLRDYCIDLEVLWRKIKHKPIIFSNESVCGGPFERILVEIKKL